MKWFRRAIALAGLILVCSSPALATAQTANERTLQLDVIELVGGERVEGQGSLAAKHGKYTYHFATEENLAIFLMNPEKYEVQLGGSCARMGALSGEGSERLPAAHDGKVYLFASEACRARFLESPEAFLLTPDEPLATTEERRTRGRALLGKAVDAMACQAKIDGVQTYREELARDEKHGETKYHITSTLVIRRPDGAHWRSCWNESCWGYAATTESAWMISSEGIADLNEQQRMELAANAGRHPFALLWARDAGDMVISADGSVRTIHVHDEGDVSVELVALHRQGLTSTLGIDAQGRIRLLAYRGRGPNMTIGQVERIYSKYHDVNGLFVPGRVDVTFEGKVVISESGEFSAQSFDDPADQANFARPVSGAASAAATQQERFQ